MTGHAWAPGRRLGFRLLTLPVLLAALVAATLAVTAASFSTPAHAGTIGVIQCGDVYTTPTGLLRQGVFPFRDAGAGFIPGGNAGQGGRADDCNGPDYGVGRGQSALMGGTYSQQGAASVTQTWTAPSGTLATGYVARLGSRTRPEADGAWGETSAQHEGQVDPYYDFREMRGSGYWSSWQVVGSWIPEGARWIRFSAGCGGYSLASVCQPGADISQIVVAGLQVQLTDNNNPQASNVSGDAVTSAYWKGTVSVSAQMTDSGTGVYRMVFQRRGADGTWSDQAEQAIDANGGRCVTVPNTPLWSEKRVFGYPAPCKTAASGDFDLDTTKLDEGTGTYRVLVEDAAGNRSTLIGQGTRAIDRTAPTIDFAGTPDQCVTGELVKVAPAIKDPISGVDTSGTQVVDSTGSPLHVDADGTIECPEPSVGPLMVAAAATDRAGNTRNVARTSGVSVRAATAPKTSTAALAFGEQPQATLSAAQTVTFTADETRVSVRRLRLTGDDADAFSVWREDCTNAVLEPGQSCSVSLRFAPDTARRFNAGLALDTVRTADVAAIALSGWGGSLPAGPPGKDGKDGANGNDGHSTIGSPGASVFGPKGDTGAQGEKGDTGAAGAAGSAGANGKTGPKGAKGDKGDKGAKGDPGVPGPRGRLGLRGRDGAAGRLAYYTCHPRRGNGRYRLACFVRVSGGGSRTVTVRVTRGSKVIAAASRRLRNGQHDVPLFGRAAPKAGRYRVEVRVIDGAKRQVVAGTFNAAP